MSAYVPPLAYGVASLLALAGLLAAGMSLRELRSRDTITRLAGALCFGAGVGMVCLALLSIVR